MSGRRSSTRIARPGRLGSIVSVALGLAVSGCGGSGDDDSCDAVDPTTDGIVGTIAAGNCTLSACHDSVGPEPTFAGIGGGINLTSVAGLCDLIDRPAVTDTEERPLIAPGDCDGSYLVIKIDPARRAQITTTQEYRELYGTDASAMPQSTRGSDGPPLCDGQVQAVCEWIDQGVPGCP